jgi:hypothetical protein
MKTDYVPELKISDEAVDLEAYAIIKQAITT